MAFSVRDDPMQSTSDGGTALMERAVPPGIVGRVWGFLAKWRSLPPYELGSYLLMFAAAPMLALGVRRYDAALLGLVACTVISLYAGFFAALIWNDITDAEIDSVVHPDRPIPSGRISK